MFIELQIQYLQEVSRHKERNRVIAEWNFLVFIVVSFQGEAVDKVFPVN